MLWGNTFYPDDTPSALAGRFRMLQDKTDMVMRACNEVGEDIVRVSKRKRVQEDFDDSVRAQEES